MAPRVFVVGVGMTRFTKPGDGDRSYAELAFEAGTKALADAGIAYGLVEEAFCGYVYGSSTCGQRAVYGLGMTGIPVTNVNNNCATGSTALYLGRQAVLGGDRECVLCLGFEKMEKGPLKPDKTKPNPLDWSLVKTVEICGWDPKAPPAPQQFGNAGREHMQLFGSTPTHFAKIGYKNHKHSINNPYSQFRDEYTLEQIQASRPIHTPLTMLQCSPTSNGSAAAVLCSEAFVRRHRLEAQAVEILGQVMRTDPESSVVGGSLRKIVGYDMCRDAAARLFSATKVSPQDVQVVELHDCFSANELITYEALGLCEEGKAADFIDRGDNTYGGRFVVNPSGGLISKGHPLGATGLAQCAELTWQLRGVAGPRQVAGARLALQHNLGLGGACVLTLYRKAFPDVPFRAQDAVARHGYNPAVEAREIEFTAKIFSKL
eukprot:TRINITY_DN8692_c0_g1_i1.p1 TRINITY_DN8692_c0_g1~~TRINITY_DN8692_c0_g1_i1.p1  ORF type:complete len:432 (+),score=134.99 TRINITY_DN8692_c0_g1_i1:57-1352(+)